MKAIFSIFLAASFGAIPFSSAQDDSTQTSTIVVSAAPLSESLTVPSKKEAKRELEKITGGAEVIDSEQYLEGRASTLKDALDYAPGVFVQSRFGAEEARVSIRGSGIQRTFHGRGLELLQDGIPLNLADGSFDFQAVEPLTADYIEVFRGANALQYGGTTLGGAINFVSHDGYTAPRLEARAEIGSFGYYRGQLSSGDVRGPNDYFASISEFALDGFRDHSQQDTQRLFVNIGRKIGPTIETRFYLTYVHSDSELPGSLSKEELNADPTQAQRNSFTPIFDVVLSDWQRNFELIRLANRTTWRNGLNSLEVATYWSHKDLDHPILFVIDQLSNDFGISARFTNESDLFDHRNAFTLGLRAVYGVLEDNRFFNLFGRRGDKFADNQQTSANTVVYAENQFYLTSQLSLVIGAQLIYALRDNDDEFPISASHPDNSDRQSYDGFNPKIGLLYSLGERSQLFTNVSRSFEPPSFGELVAAPSGSLVQLDAQTATSAEIGIRGNEHGFQWDVAYYYAWLDDELLTREVMPGFTATVNAGATRHQGIEASAELPLLRGIFSHADAPSAQEDGKAATATTGELDRLVLRQNYLWNDFRFSRDPLFGNNRLAGVPEHYYRAELVYEHPSGFYFGPNVEWVPTRYPVDFENTLYADPYVLLGFKIGYRREQGPSAFVEVRNLLDETYAATTGVIDVVTPFNRQQFMPGDGRAFYAGLEFKW